MKTLFKLFPVVVFLYMAAPAMLAQSRIKPVDMGLSVMWGDDNLWTDLPKNFHDDYYSWGETEVHYKSGAEHINDRTWEQLSGHSIWRDGMGSYWWTSYKWCRGSADTITKYGTQADKDNTILDLEDDVAHRVLGGNWRMPSEDEWRELLQQCSWKCKGDQGGMYLLNSKDTLYLSACGYRVMGDCKGDGYIGSYWSSSLAASSREAVTIRFNREEFEGFRSENRCSGRSIRPVLCRAKTLLYAPYSELDFGELESGQDASKIIKIRNAGLTDLLVSISTPSGPFSCQEIKNRRLQAGEALTVTVSYIPNGEYLANGELVIKSNDPQNETRKITLTGRLARTSYSKEPGKAVDLGLPSGTRWASYNVGAVSPEDCGGYYAWGETDPKDVYDWNSYRWSEFKGSITKYNIRTYYDFNKIDNITRLEPEDDVAHMIWGLGWRMPTQNDFIELAENCKAEMVILNGVEGFRFTSKLNGNSIFLPCCGMRSDKYFCYKGAGCYWSSDVCERSESANCLYFSKHEFNQSMEVRTQGELRAYGLCVRPVVPKDAPSSSLELSFGIGRFGKDFGKAEAFISRYGSAEDAAKVRKAAIDYYLNGGTSEEEALRYFVAHRDQNNTDVIVDRMVSRCNNLESLTKVNTTVQRILYPEDTKFENDKEYHLLSSPAHVYIAQRMKELTGVKGYAYYKSCTPVMQKALDRFASDSFRSYECCVKTTQYVKEFYSTYPNKAVVASVRNGITGSLDSKLAQDDDLANLVDLYRIAEKLVSEDVVNPLDNMKVLENNIKKKAKSTISSKSKSLWQSYMHNGTDDKRAWNSLVQDLDGAIKYVKDCLPEMYSVIVTQDDINFLAQSSELPAVRESFGREATGDDPFPTLRKHLATYPDSNYSILLKTTYEQLCDTYAKERAMKLSRSSSDAEKQTVKNLAKTDIGKDMISRFVDNGLATKDKYDKKGLHYTFDDIAYGNIPVELARIKERNKPSVHFGLDLEWYTHGFKDRGFLIGPAMTLCLRNSGLAADLAVLYGYYPQVHNKEDKSVIFSKGVCVPVSLRYTMFGSVYVSAGALLQKPLSAGYCSLSDETVNDMGVVNPFAVSPKVSLGLLYDDDYVTEFEFGCCFDSPVPLINYDYIQSSGIEALISPENFAKQKSDMRFFITYRYYF